MGQTTFSGPVAAGTLKDQGAGYNVGLALLSQTIVMNQNNTTPVTTDINVPEGAQLLFIVMDVLTAFDSATSAALTVGTTGLATAYVTTVDVKVAGRASYTFTAAQLDAMDNVGTNTVVRAVITPTGATTAGRVQITYVYIQKP